MNMLVHFVYQRCFVSDHELRRNRGRVAFDRSINLGTLIRHVFAVTLL